jgi:hypothetical protein
MGPHSEGRWARSIPSIPTLRMLSQYEVFGPGDLRCMKRLRIDLTSRYQTTQAMLSSPSTSTASKQDGGLRTALSLGASGALEVVRITKQLSSSATELVFVGVPARHGGQATSIQVSFTTEVLRPAPRFDPSTGRIHLFYPDRDHPEVQGLLNSKRNRFCYFWRSIKGGHTHAWLLSSQ